MDNKKELCIGIINSEIKKWRFLEEIFGPSSKEWVAKKIGALRMVIDYIEHNINS